MSSELRAIWEKAGGQLPQHWKIEPLESLLRDNKSITVGVMYPGPDTPGGTPLIKVGDIKDGVISVRPSYCISTATNQEHKRTQLEGNELLITLVGNPGECVVVKPEMVGWNPARAIAVIRLKDPELRTYLKAVLESRAGRHLIDAVLNTTVQKTLNLKDIRKLPIPLPSSSTIKEISEFSEALTDRITLLRETNATLEAIAQALFKSWFVDFDPVRAKMKGRAPEGMDEAAAALFPDALEESELGWVPKGWRVAALSHLSKISSGARPNVRSDVITDAAAVPLFGGAGVMGFTDESLYQSRKILTGRVGTLGKVHISYPPFWASDNVLVLSPEDECNFIFCFHWLKSIDVHALNRGSTQPLLTQKDLGKQQHLIPDKSIMRTFSDTTESLYQAIRQNAIQAQTIATLRDTLLPRLISGQLRLPEAMAETEEAAA